ncbi:MAG: ABC transporter permease [Anaerolineae bacterium]|nr:ABC transporter permease [Anaerolineae bacterium]
MTPKTDQVKRLRWGRAIGRPPRIVWIGLGWLLVMIFIAIFAEQLAPYRIDEIFLRNRLEPPGTDGFILGTDKIGRDIWTRLLFSIQLSMFVATLGTIIGGVLGTTLGLVAAYFGGIVDEIIMLMVDFQASLPTLIFAITLLAFFGNSLPLFILVLGILGWEGYARIARGLALSLQNREFVTAATVLGAKPLHIYLRHVLPNLFNALLVNFTLNFPGTILAEAGLSFLGLGVQPPHTSLGLMLSTGREYLATEWWLAVFPGMVIFFTTLSISVIGDWLRDVLDPTSQS